MKQTKHKILSVFLSVCMIVSCMVGMSVTASAAPAETLLTTLTFGGSSTYSETKSGVVSVTATNVTQYNAKFGWLWYYEGSLSVTAEEGYTITKCVFIQNAKTPITDTVAPFEIHSGRRGQITEDTNEDMDGVTSIEVYGYVPVTGVSLDKTSLELEVGGGTETLTATVTPNNATDQTVTWTSSNTEVATVADGVVTPVAAGTATITATATNGTDVISDDKTATCSVTVKAATVAVTGVTLDKTTTSIEVGKTETLTATVTPANATDKAVTWSSDKPAVATVDENGKITAVAEGNATITVTTTDGKKTATCDVTVKAAADPEPEPSGDVLVAKSGSPANIPVPSSMQNSVVESLIVEGVADAEWNVGGGIQFSASTGTNTDWGGYQYKYQVDTGAFTINIAPNATISATSIEAQVWWGDSLTINKVTMNGTVIFGKSDESDTTALAAAVKTATEYYDSIKSNYSSIAETLKSAIDEAQKVLDNANATKDEIDAAVKALNTAVSTAKSAVSAQSNTTPSYTPSYTPTYTPSATTTTTTTTETKTEETASFEGETTKNNTDALSWSGIKDAKSYTISVEVDGKYVELATTTSTTVDVIHAANGNYYVSENGKYTKYVYEDGKFVEDGTISVSKAEKLTKANDVTDDYMLQYTDAEGKTSTVENALFTSVTTYYKPAVKTKVSGDTAKLSWKKVTDATRYALYQVKSDGTLKLLKKTNNAKLNIIDLKSGKTYKFAVRALVDGKWTSVKTSDVVKVKVK